MALLCRPVEAERSPTDPEFETESVGEATASANPVDHDDSPHFVKE